MFDLLDVPIFGRAEDAADAFSAYMMLELGKNDAERLIVGAAYAYKDYVRNPNVCVRLIAFADAHALLCSVSTTCCASHTEPGRNSFTTSSTKGISRKVELIIAKLSMMK